MTFKKKLVLTFMTPLIISVLAASVVRALPVQECSALKAACKKEGGTVTECADIYLKCRSTPSA